MSSTYFSNHSNQSRFLAISQSSSPSLTPPAPAQPTPAPRTRRSTSKLFSTSVSVDHGPGESGTKSTKSDSRSSSSTPSIIHPLRTTWVFYFRQQRAPGTVTGTKLPLSFSYEEGIKRIASFASVESFWSLQTHLVPPSGLVPTTDYLLFHSSIARPVWEDPGNIMGGKWILRLRKGVADRIWEALVCAVVGDMFAGCREPSTTKESWEDSDSSSPDDNSSSTSADADDNALTAPPEICGCTISVRATEDIVSLWNRVDHDVKTRDRIRDVMKQVLGLPQGTNLEYKSNNDSMQDKDRSLFRAALGSSSSSNSLGNIAAAA
ncbi:translation initiation factor eIF4e [Mycena amicta]|nr:translation initiation factor eIF4e [Mycena amicta]